HTSGVLGLARLSDANSRRHRAQDTREIFWTSRYRYRSDDIRCTQGSSDRHSRRLQKVTPGILLWRQPQGPLWLISGHFQQSNRWFDSSRDRHWDKPVRHWTSVQLDPKIKKPHSLRWNSAGERCVKFRVLTRKPAESRATPSGNAVLCKRC